MGGYRYRGNRVPSIDGAIPLQRQLLRTALGLRTLWTRRRRRPRPPTCWEDVGSGVYAFAEDRLGELYMARGFNGTVQCVHSGQGCYWASWRGLFEDDFESNGFTHWSDAVGD